MGFPWLPRVPAFTEPLTDKSKVTPKFEQNGGNQLKSPITKHYKQRYRAGTVSYRSMGREWRG